eukprot:TRINITY_DN4421_c0_g1_i1.p1 TRINITY_DN4421_c0_g1~~TRINITY_DN4421_c0_g1_i1.p1  ORF type:complete len:75 (+),score=5.43 TRINITY_DN4421_c0_g1_i1:25-249(+)
MDVLLYSHCIDRVICSGRHEKMQDEARCPVSRTEFMSGDVVLYSKLMKGKFAKASKFLAFLSSDFVSGDHRSEL